MYGAETFREDALRALRFLIDDYGFRPVSESERLVRLESRTVGVEALLDRGQIDVTAFRLGLEEPSDRWTYTGMIGRASVARVLEMGAEALLAEPPVLNGDAGFFERLGAAQRREAEEWTAYYSGAGPRPQTGRLPG